jgi:hypothetical protein
MQEPRNLERIILTVNILLIIGVLALSFVNPVISKKPEITGKKVTNNGAINSRTEIEIYWNKKGTKKVSSIPWGSLEPGINKTITLFIRNNDKNQITLGFYTSNWAPQNNANYLNLKWDYAGQSIQFKEIVQIIFTLSVSENIKTAGTFSFDITIIGNQ